MWEKGCKANAKQTHTLLLLRAGGGGPGRTIWLYAVVACGGAIADCSKNDTCHYYRQQPRETKAYQALQGHCKFIHTASRAVSCVAHLNRHCSLKNSNNKLCGSVSHRFPNDLTPFATFWRAQRVHGVRTRKLFTDTTLRYGLS